MGVRRAVELAEKALDENASSDCGSCKKVFSLGPLIHNNAALADLASRGLSVLKDTDDAKINNFCSWHTQSGIVIIRAHGVPPETQKNLEKKFEVLDATCPLVKRSQKIAAEYAEKGWTVILAGDKNHGEVIGIAGYAGKNFALIQNEFEAEAFVAVSDSAVLLAQTTFSEFEFKKIENTLNSKIKNLKVINTICPATQERQNALAELAPKVDGVLVIGGKNSANTGRLFSAAQKLCKSAALIENADEIPQSFFSLDTVGLAAGASTPDIVIESVERALMASI